MNTDAGTREGFDNSSHSNMLATNVELYASEFSAQVPDGVPKAAKITSSITAPVPEQARVTSPPPSCFWISIYEVTTVHGKWKVVKPTVFAVCNN